MNRYEKLMGRIRKGERIMIDGGTGTEVERRGVPQLENAWNSGGTLSHPDIVRGIHEDYIRFGAKIVISNTFATSRNNLEDAGVLDLFEEFNRRAVVLACEARQTMGKDEVLVAGGMSHWSFSGRLPSLKLLKDGAAEQARIMRNAGADLIMLEMMVDIPRMLAVLDGAKESGLPVWVGLSCVPNTDGTPCLLSGETDENGTVIAGAGATLAEAIAALAGKDVPLLSIMHTDVRHVNACIDIVDSHWKGLVGVYAHTGHFTDGKWVFEGTISPDEYKEACESWLDRNVQVIGGCCGIRPDHIATLGNLFEE